MAAQLLCYSPLRCLQVQAYVKAYAQHFDLYRHIRLQSRLIQLRPREDGSEGWTVLFQDLLSLKVFKVRRGRRGSRMS